MQVSAESLAAFLDTLTGCEQYLVAYSGGMDSHVLLHLLACQSGESDYSIRAVHINHNIQQEGRIWVGHCQNTCRALGIDLEVIDVDANRPGKESPESRARQQRYAALENILSEGEVLLTAHHQDDQLETLLLRLLRGSGVLGLASMRAVRPFGNGLHARPLLPYRRVELLDYAKRNKLDWVDDPSNADLRFDRNFIRHEVLPVIKNRWPSVALPVTRAIAAFAEAQELLDEAARQDLSDCVTEAADVLAVDRVTQLPISRQKNMIRHWARSLNLPSPDSRQLSHIVTDVLAARRDSNARVRWKGAELQRYGNYLYLAAPLEEFDGSAMRVWDFPVPCRLDVGELTAVEGYGNGLKKELCSGANVEIRYRSGGEKIRLPGRTCRHKLKKLFQEAGVPPWLRARVPLIYIDNKLAMVAGFWTDAEFAASADEASWKITWKREVVPKNWTGG